MTRKARGFALIDLIFTCGIIGVLAGIALPRLTTAKAAADTASAIGSMRTINSAELTFALTCGGGFYAPNLSTLGTAPAGSNQSFIGGGLGSTDIVTKSRYIVQIGAAGYPGAPASCNGMAAGIGGQGFTATADPVSTDNLRFFGTNSDGLTYENTTSFVGLITETGRPSVGVPLH